MFVAQHNERLTELIHDSSYIDAYAEVKAGKFRRYHGRGLLQHLYPKTFWLNLRDFFRVCIGFVQACRLLRREKPAVIFIKGGFVGVPVGLAAATLRVPYITHDSDVLPGLANRLVGRWARHHAISFAATADYYKDGRSIQTGPIIGKSFKRVSKLEQAALKESLGFRPDQLLMLVTGGGLGAQRLNEAVVGCVSKLLEEGMQVVHLTGKGNGSAIQQYYDSRKTAPGQIQVQEFSMELYKYSGAADIVVTRAGATALAEFSAQAKACIVVPNPLLTGGHQSLNAQELEKKDLAIVVQEQPLDTLATRLGNALEYLLDNPEQRLGYAEKLHKGRMRQSAAEGIADLLLEQC